MKKTFNRGLEKTVEMDIDGRTHIAAYEIKSGVVQMWVTNKHGVYEGPFARMIYRAYDEKLMVKMMLSEVLSAMKGRGDM